MAEGTITILMGGVVLAQVAHDLPPELDVDVTREGQVLVISLLVERAAKSAELFKGEDGWRFRLVAANGEVIAASEAYVRKTDARNAAKALAPVVHDAK